MAANFSNTLRGVSPGAASENPVLRAQSVWVVGATPDVVNGHNGIWQQRSLISCNRWF
jgi:hypothetical protein